MKLSSGEWGRGRTTSVPIKRMLIALRTIDDVNKEQIIELEEEQTKDTNTIEYP